MKDWRESSISRVLTLAAMFVLFSLAASAQSPSEGASAQKRPILPEDELLGKMRAARNDPAQYLELTIKLVNEFPESRYAESAGFNFSSALKKQSQNANDPAKLRELAKRFIEGTASAPAQLRVRINSYAVRAMLDRNLAEEAAALASQTTPLLDEKEYLAFMRRGYDRDIASATKTNPNYKPRPFLEGEFSERFRQEVAAYYTLLGRAYFKLDKLSQAEATFKRAYETWRDAPAAAGLATILEKQGKDKDALEYMTQAVLTGRLDKAGIEQFHALYRRTHGGKLDGVEEYLDARYRKIHSNPVKGARYVPTSARTDRTVLAEFFTGAGCIPCIPFDYTFEKALEDYSRRELALLVYHWHAPSLDPMGNRSSDARAKYYGVEGAPTIFLDGQKFADEGVEARVKSAAEKRAAGAYSAVTSVINKRLEAPSQARLRFDLERLDKGVKAVVAVYGLKDAAPDISLQLALVEDEVHYSGENGLRFHPLVVRNLARAAGADDYGFKVDPSRANNFTHTFDLDAISAENLRYYDEWPVERNKEVNARIGGDADFDVGRFKEQRHLINSDKLSVVAFLQDNKTRQILQSVFLRLAPVGKQDAGARSK
jgi:tetratricopeptide (TPR) repeat protein